ncbi:MAG: NAD(P)/FAD-dependent oxidoreductase [Bacillota bacterium]|nr:NAD(P)/FAD-dependent oxidoreductase [Bacillota bacterium]
MKTADVIIIGAGGVGCAIARELSRYRLDITVLEKGCDVAGGTSGRNSAVVHAGFNNRPGSLMAGLCVEGNKGFEALCAQLDVPYKKTGKLIAAFDDEDIASLHHLIIQGETNGCSGLRIVRGEELRSLVPGTDAIAGMYSPETAIFDPFTYCIALAENALSNGVRFRLQREVIKIDAEQDGMFCVRTAAGETFRSRYLINCAGLYAGSISEMAGGESYRIYPCRGEYFILDKIAPEILPMPVYPAPKKGIGGLGVHLTPTMAGNIIIGPSAEYIDDREDYSCSREVMDKLLGEAETLLPAIDRKYIIGNYAGIRPKLAPPGEGGYRDFVIKEDERQPHLINLIGIESPGLTASYPIARRVRDILSQSLELAEKQDFIPDRKGPVRFRDLSEAEQKALIQKDPEYGRIICRCQKVTKREIRNAIENPLGARSISAIKYRAWATTGRCNGGYCLSRIVDMLVDEYGMNPAEITYRDPGSEMFTGNVK